MVRTSNQDDALLADLLQHPGIKVLEGRLEARKTDDTHTLALAVISVDAQLDQRKIDETRGFWRGADWFLREAKRGKRAFERNSEDGEPE